jgi:hypothetical protein
MAIWPVSQGSTEPKRPFFAWHNELARVEKSLLLEARGELDAAADERKKGHELLSHLHPPAAKLHQSLLQELASTACCPIKLRQMLRWIYY